MITHNKQSKIAYTNICGINANIDAVHHYLQSARPDAFFLTEAQISGKNSLKHLKFPGYELLHNYRLHGGVCVFVRSSLSSTRLPALESGRRDILWLKLCIKASSKYICCVYRSPSDDACHELLEYLSQKIDYLNSEYPSSEVVVLGDFNVHHESWLKSNKTDPEGRLTEAFAIGHGMSQLVDKPTYFPRVATHSANILDLFLTTNPDSYNINVTSPLGNSDHALIEVKYPIQPEKTEVPPPRTLWHYRSADWDGLREYFSAFPWDAVCFPNKDASTSCANITEVIQCAMATYIPHSLKISRPKQKPWFTKDCDLARMQKIKTHRRFMENTTPLTNQEDINARNHYNKTVRASKEKYNERIRQRVMNCPNGSRSFWSLAKHIKNNFTNSSFPPLTADDGTIVTSSRGKAELFAKVFSVNSTLNPPINKVVPTVPNVMHKMPSIKFKVKLVRKILLTLDTNKASGLDQIPALLLKKCAPELAPVFTKLFQLSYDSGVFPDIWKTARIQPVPKKGSKTLPSNYRPIALLSAISKALEKYINTEILKHLETHKLIHDRQYGFRRLRSTADLLTYVTHIWNDTLQSYGETQVVALDITKAFDQVWHAALLNKLPSYGLPQELCRWIGNFLFDRSIQVAVDGHSSDHHKINAGVPQGSALAPTLFLIHINDLLFATVNPIHSFADDSTLHSSIRSQKPVSTSQNKANRRAQATSLSRDLDIIVDWGYRNLVNFNASKTQSCCLSSKRHANNHYAIMNGEALQHKTSFKLVGVQISQDLLWHEHVASLASAAGKKLGFLFRARKLFSPSNLATLYKAQVRPGLEYCSHVWGAAAPSTLAVLDSVQRRAIRLIGDPNLTRSIAPLSHRRAVADLSLFYRYFNGMCSTELSSIVPQLARPLRMTRQTEAAHRHTVQLCTSRTLRFDRTFVPRVSRLWNSLPPHVFPDSPNLQSFKSRINKLPLLSL